MKRQLMQTVWAHLLLLALTATGITARLMREVCENAEPATTYPQEPTMPVVPNTFEVHVDCKMGNKNQSTEVHEYYDYENNRGVVQQVQYGNRFYLYYDYNSNEMLSIFPDDGSCYVDNLNTNINRFLFGYKNGHIFSPSGALHFGFSSVISSYQGPGVVRSIRVHTWYSCQYIPEMDATVNVYWSFTDPLNWDTAIGYPYTPVRCRVAGVAKNSMDNGSHPFSHVYDFIHFKNFLSENALNAFETPDGVACPGRINTKPLPSLPSAFSMTVEAINKVNRQVAFLQEWYAKDLNLVKFIYLPGPGKSLLYGSRLLTEVHDYNTGVAYIMDDMLGNCSVVPIEQGGFDDERQGAGDIRIRTAAEYLYLDNVQVAYQGQKTVRGMPADSWIAVRPNFPPGTQVNGTMQWLFIANNWTSTVAKQASYTGGTPIQMRFTLGEDMQYDYNLYHFNPKVDASGFDITSCYTNRRRRHFDFAVPGQYSADVRSNMRDFGQSVLTSVMQATSLSPLRIKILGVVFLDDVHIRVELLDKAPISGDVSSVRAEPELDAASLALKSHVQGSSFIVGVGPSAQKQVAALRGSFVEYDDESSLLSPTATTPVPGQTVTAKPGQTASPGQTVAPPTVAPPTVAPPTVAPPTVGFTTTGKTLGPTTTSSSYHPNSQGQQESSSKKYSPGDMGGLSVGMLLLGALLGTGSAFVYLRRSNYRR